MGDAVLYNTLLYVCTLPIAVIAEVPRTGHTYGIAESRTVLPDQRRSGGKKNRRPTKYKNPGDHI